MCIVTFRALCTMSVLVAAKHAANAMAQKMQSVKSPKQVCFDLRVQISKLGSLCSE